MKYETYKILIAQRQPKLFQARKLRKKVRLPSDFTGINCIQSPLEKLRNGKQRSVFKVRSISSQVALNFSKISCVVFPAFPGVFACKARRISPIITLIRVRKSAGSKRQISRRTHWPSKMALIPVFFLFGEREQPAHEIQNSRNLFQDQDLYQANYICFERKYKLVIMSWLSYGEKKMHGIAYAH